MSKNGLFVEYCAKDFLDGVLLLDPWEELAYRRICDMIYATNNNLVDDDKKLAWATKTGNRWAKIKRALIAAEKIFCTDGVITNEKCTKTLAKSQKNINQKSDAGKASAEARKALENNETDATAVDGAASAADTTGVPTNQEPKNPSSSGSKEPSEDHARISHEVLVEAIEAWNAMAHDCGLPKVEKHTEQRKKLVRVRLLDCGGLPGWNVALDRIKASPFLLGDNRNGWRADFDFIVKSQNFTKLIEGGYDQRAARPILASVPAVDAATSLLIAKVAVFRKHGRWDRENDGPAPGEPDCRVPASILQREAA